MKRDHAADCQILVVDDNRDAADTLVSLLGLFGFKAHAVYDGAHAVLAAEVLQPSLVFLDLFMPGMDGYETASCIRQIDDADGIEAGRAIELVALTARNRDVDEILSSAVGFDLHVQKPIGVKQLCWLAEKARLRH